MPGKESKADEKQKQVGDEHSFMGKMREQAGEAAPSTKPVPKSFLMMMMLRPVRAGANVCR